MKIINLINPEYILSSDVDLAADIEKIEHDPQLCDGNSLLVIPNSKKCPKSVKAKPYAAVCDGLAVLPPEIPTIRVENVRYVISKIYAAFYGVRSPKFKLIGITGTNGKTSTATFIKHALTSSGMKVGFIGTGIISIAENILNDRFYSMTTPDPWVLYPTLKRMEEEGCEAVVMEVSSHALELEKVAPLRFDIGIFTNLSLEHLDFHGDVESYYRAKKKLFSQSDKAIVNIDDYYGRRIVKETDGAKLTAGILWRGDAYVSNIQNNGFDGIEYVYHGRTFSFTMKLTAAGIYNIYNSMLAISACTELGLKPCEVKRSLSAISAVKGRYEIIKDVITVIIDYAHTDTAMQSMLKNLTETKTPGQKVTVIFGCGGERDRDKRARMAAVAETYAYKTVVTTDNPRGEDPSSIIEDIIKGFSTDNYTVIPDREQAIKSTIATAVKNDIIAVIGKGSEKYCIDKNGYHDFDEAAIIREALKLRREELQTCE